MQRVKVQVLGGVGADAAGTAVVARLGDGGGGDASVRRVRVEYPPLQQSSGVRLERGTRNRTYESGEIVVEHFAVSRLALERRREVLELGVVLRAEGLKERDRFRVAASLVDEGGDDLERRDADDHVVCAVDLAARAAERVSEIAGRRLQSLTYVKTAAFVLMLRI